MAPFVGRQIELAVLRAGWPMRLPDGRRSCRSRARPGSARPRCSTISWPRPAPARAGGGPGQRRGDRGVAGLRRGRAARAVDQRDRWPGRRPRGRIAVGASAGAGRRPGHRRHPVAGFAGSARWRAGDPGCRRCPLGRSAVAAGADLRPAPARRRPGADHRGRARRQHCRPAGQSRPVGERTSGHRAAVARAGRGGSAGPGRGDGHRGHRCRARRAGCRYGTQGNPLHARALLEEFPPAAMGPRRSIAAVAEVVPPVGPGPLRSLVRPTPAG